MVEPLPVHEVTITHDKRVFARAWGVVCKNCSFRAAAASEAEAKKLSETHQRLEEQKEILKARGFLK
jgi:hypothetical protein